MLLFLTAIVVVMKGVCVKAQEENGNEWCIILIWNGILKIFNKTVLRFIPEDSDYESTNAIDDHNVKVTENRLAAQLFAVLEHYKQEDPLGFPGAPIPDPMDVPDMKKSLGMANLNMMKVKAYGLSKFRIANINADLNAMKVSQATRVELFFMTLLNVFGFFFFSIFSTGRCWNRTGYNGYQGHVHFKFVYFQS